MERKMKQKAAEPLCSAATTGYVQGTFVWYNVEMSGPPVPEDNEFYGERYSVPVMIANSNTQQIEKRTVVFDYKDGGWCLYGFPDGANSQDYELILPTHFCYLPPIPRSDT